MSAFRITYWGTTGTISSPLKPSEVTEKLVQAILALRQSPAWEDLAAVSDAAAVRECLTRYLPYHLRSTFGGNTTCVEVETDDALLIFDSGSGFRELGMKLLRRWTDPAWRGERSAHVILSHPHMDHTYATPVFDPYFDSRNHFTIWAPQAVLDSLDALLARTARLKSVFFPPSFEMMTGLQVFNAVAAGQEFHIGKTRIRTYLLNHPGGCLAYRLDRGEHSFVFATDHEHTEVPDHGLAQFAVGADVLYLDGQYLQCEYDGTTGIMGEPPLKHIGWGHSSVEACLATAVEAGVKRLHLGHREPKRDDADLARVEAYAQRQIVEKLANRHLPPDACRVEIAREGLELEL